MIKIFNRTFHAVLDYGIAILLFISPWIIGIPADGGPYIVFLLAGVSILLMSILTDYPGGIFKRLPMQMHLEADFFLGLFLAISPWAFEFADVTWVYHVGVGVFSMFAALFTKTAKDDLKQQLQSN